MDVFKNEPTPLQPPPSFVKLYTKYSYLRKEVKSDRTVKYFEFIQGLEYFFGWLI